MGGAVYPCNSSVPLSYFQGTVTPPIPCGAHFRLPSSYTLTCSPACPQAQMILTAMKNYGLYVMDQNGNGAGFIYLSMYWNGSAFVNPWNATDTNNLTKIPMSAFEVVPPYGCASVAACVKTRAEPLGLDPGICAFIPEQWRHEHPALYRRLCHYLRRH